MARKAVEDMSVVELDQLISWYHNRIKYCEYLKSVNTSK